MSISMRHSVLATLALAAISTVTNAAPVLHDGRYYEVVAADRISWADANAAANARTHLGVEGHLATINSPEEDAFVNSLNVPPSSRSELWVGGFQENCTPEPGCGWKWINDELISAANTAFPYTNWHAGEPNDDATGSGDETNLVISHRNGIFGWNDQDRSGEVWGYVVEYGDKLVPFLVNECSSGLPGPGCALVTREQEPVTIIKLPSSAQFDEENDLYTVRTWVVDDDPARCATGTPKELELLDAEPGPEAIIPGYLCTHPDNPKFLVIKTESNVEIPSGVVAITNDTTVPLNPAYICKAPIPAGESVFAQDIVVFQYDDKNDMLEHNFPGADPFDGSVIESTNGCINPSRGSGGRGSFIFVGLSIHQGTAPSSHQRLLDLVKYKLDVLAVAIDRARADGAIDKGLHSKAKNEVKAARGDITNGNYREALRHVQNFQKFTKDGVFKTVPDGEGGFRNWNGEFLMRGDNLAFTVSVKLIPSAL